MSLVVREVPRLRIVSDELWARVKARQSEQAIGTTKKSGKPATSLLSGLLLCEDCGSPFIASDQHGYQCATRTYGGVCACANKVRVNRERAEAAIVDYLAEELLSPAAVALAQRAYQEAVRQELAAAEPKVEAPDTIHAEEVKLKEMMKAGTLSLDVAQAALDALAQKRRKIVSARSAPVVGVEAFALAAERYQDAVRNLGKHVAGSARATEERGLVRELLGGHGTVFTRDGRIGARFASAGLLNLAGISCKSGIYNIGSGGLIVEPPTVVRWPLVAYISDTYVKTI